VRPPTSPPGCKNADPDSVALSPTTYRLVSGLFECEALGSRPLKGLSAPIAVYRVVGESGAQSRFEAAVQAGLTPLVGREEELQLLHNRWAQARDRNGQAVLLSGEAGIGKSRLVQAIKDRCMRHGAVPLEFRCSPYSQNTALFALIQHLERRLEFARTDAVDGKLARLQQFLAQYPFTQPDTLPLWAALLSLPLPADAPPAGSPQKQKQRILETVVAWIGEVADKAPVFCAFEDLHWADPSTLEFLELLLAQLPATQILLLLTFRAEFQPPWGRRSYLSPLTLSRLGPPQSTAMIGGLTSGKPLPTEVLQQIVDKTDGVPLFVEELTKMVLESGLLREGEDRYELTGPLPPLAIPATLHGSLIARLDRLAPIREVAQLGATLGREFSYELLGAVAPVDEHTLQHALARLVEAEVLYQQGLPPQARYLFKHALIQDAAYQSLLKSKRQQYHQQIAGVLETGFAETNESQPELIAHHYTEAGLVEHAIPWWQKAGQRSIRRSANLETIAHLTKALGLLESLPNMPERAQQELSLHITLGGPMIATKGHSAPEVERVYARARDLCGRVGETPQLCPVLNGLRLFYVARGDLRTGRELGERCLAIAQKARDPALVLEAHQSLGVPLFFMGEFAMAWEHLEQSILLYDPEQHRSHAFRYGRDPGVAGPGYLGWALWFLGYPEQALRRAREALALAREIAHAPSIAIALNCLTFLHQHCRDAVATQQSADEMIALATEQGLPLWLALETMLHGWALVEQGRGNEGVAEMRGGLAGYQAIGSELNVPYFLGLLAEAKGKAGQMEEGLALLAEALAMVDKNRECAWEAELYRLKGMLTLQSADQSPTAKFDEAEGCFHHALAIARRQQAKSWELRTAISLAQLWRQQDKQQDARQELAETYGWFTEGFGTKDLREAKALLQALR
jgi:predicted ATPase